MQATLTATPTTTDAPSLLERQSLRRTAMEAHARAFQPRPIPQKNGDTLHLCWVARLGRAYTIRDAETDANKRNLYQQALDRMVAEAESDYARAKETWAAYQQACEQASVPPAEFPLLCDCDGCRATYAVLEANMERRHAAN